VKDARKMGEERVLNRRKTGMRRSRKGDKNTVILLLEKNEMFD